MLRRKYREIYYFFSSNEKKLDNIKAIVTNESLLIALDFCRANYQNLLNIYQMDFIAITANIVNLNLIIYQSKIIK